MSVLINAEVRNSFAGVFVNGAFIGLPMKTGSIVNNILRLQYIGYSLKPIEIDLDSVVIYDAYGTEISISSYQGKVEVINSFLAQSIEVNSDPISPIHVSDRTITVEDIDWEASEFPGWVGNPREFFGNVNNGGIYNESTDNPKYFILRLIRSRQIRTFGIGTSIGNFSNIKATLLGSGDAERGFLDLSEQPTKQTSAVYSQEEFLFNSLLIEFYTSDRVDVTNLFFEYVSSLRKQNIIHKFGSNPEINAGGNETIWTLGDQYIFTEIPQFYYISSSSDLDNQIIEIETIGINPDGLYQREVTEIQLQGQTKVQIPTAFLCVASNRAFNTEGSPLAGNIYIYEDVTVILGVPSDISKVRSYIEAGKEQTEQAVYTVPQIIETGQVVAFAELYKWSAAIVRKRDAIAIVNLRISEIGKVARIQDTDGAANASPAGQIYGENTPLVVQPGSDIYLQITDVSDNAVAARGNFTLRLVIL